MDREQIKTEIHNTLRVLDYIKDATHLNGIPYTEAEADARQMIEAEQIKFQLVDMDKVFADIRIEIARQDDPTDAEVQVLNKYLFKYIEMKRWN